MNNRELIMPHAHFPLIRGYYGSPFEYLNKERNKKEKLWVFGPLGWQMHGYQELGYKQHVAEVVMDKVLEKSGFTREELLDELGDLVPVARAAYPEGALQGLDDEEVVIRLSADTCLLLLVVFSILGAKPNFPDQHLIFGTGRVRENKEMWLRSIFFVGNQIPFFWVEKLMESLSYLESLRMEISMQGKPLELLVRTLFEFVIVSQVPKPVDVMHCLRSIILGPRAPNQDKLNIWMAKSKNPLDTVKQQLSVSALYKALHQIFGYRRIECEHRMGVVDVYLPAIEVNDDMSLELAMTSVEKWEYVHGDPNTKGPYGH